MMFRIPIGFRDSLRCLGAWPPFFETPGPWYNLLNFLFASVGLFLAVAGIWFALDQIKKTLKAAQAAKQATIETAQDIRRMTTLVDVLSLVKIADQILSHLRAKNYNAGVVRLQDLLSGVSAARNSTMGPKLFTESKWQEMTTRVSSVQDVIERALRNASEYCLDGCLRTVSDLHAELSGAASAVAQIRGEADART